MNPAPRNHIARELLLHAALLGVLLIPVFPGTILRGETALPGGLLYTMPPWSEYTSAGVDVPKNSLTFEALIQLHKWYTISKRCLKGGEWPLWNPYEFSGVPLMANYQTTFFYPPRLLHTFVDVAWATTFLLMLKIWGCGMTAYGCGRGLGLSVGAARFLSVAWMLAGFNLLWLYWPVPDVALWLPLLFLGVEYLAQGRWRKGAFTCLPSATLMLLAGHPESAFAMGIALALYLLVRLVLQRPPGPRFALATAMASTAAMGAVLVCAAQLLPFVEYVLNTSDNPLARTHVPEQGISLPWASAVSFWTPRFYGTEADSNFWGGSLVHMFRAMIYPGIAIWLLLPLAFAAPHPSSKSQGRGRVWAIGITALAGMLMAFPVPLLEPVHSLPLLKTMWRWWHVSFAVFGLPLLAAHGLDRWLKGGLGARAFAMLIPVAVAAAHLFVHWQIMSGLARIHKADQYALQQIVIAAGFAIAGLFALSASARLRAPRVGAWTITILLAIDLIAAVRGLNASSPRQQIFPDTALTRYLQALESSARVSEVSAGLKPAILSVYGIQQRWGFDGMYPERIITFYGRLGSRIWNAMEPVCSISHYLKRAEDNPGQSDADTARTRPQSFVDFPYTDAERFTRLTTLEGIEVYKNNRAAPRAFLVPNVEVIPNIEELFARMVSPDYDPFNTVVTQISPTPQLAETAGSLSGVARVTEYETTRVRIEADSPRPAALVLADAYYPGWKAYVDSVEVQIFPAYYAFRGVIVPAGAHTVEFRYFPQSFRFGLAISTMALAAGTICAAVALKDLRKRAALRSQ